MAAGDFDVLQTVVAAVSCLLIWAAAGSFWWDSRWFSADQMAVLKPEFDARASNAKNADDGASGAKTPESSKGSRRRERTSSRREKKRRVTPRFVSGSSIQAPSDFVHTHGSAADRPDVEQTSVHTTGVHINIGAALQAADNFVSEQELEPAIGSDLLDHMPGLEPTRETLLAGSVEPMLTDRCFRKCGVSCLRNMHKNNFDAATLVKLLLSAVGFSGFIAAQVLSATSSDIMADDVALATSIVGASLVAIVALLPMLLKIGKARARIDAALHRNSGEAFVPALLLFIMFTFFTGGWVLLNWLLPQYIQDETYADFAIIVNPILMITSFTLAFTTYMPYFVLHYFSIMVWVVQGGGFVLYILALGQDKA